MALGYAAFSVLMLFIGGFFASEAWQNASSVRWPHTPGAIIASYSTRTCTHSRSTTDWEAKVVYRYQIDGQTLESGRVRQGPAFCHSDRREVVDWVQQRFPVGKPVEVFYDPADHKIAVLSPGEDARADGVIAAAAILFACAMAWCARRASAAP